MSTRDRSVIASRSVELSQPAGDFSSWLRAMQAAIREERDADVPCGTCTACCTSSQFVHIAPDETDTLSHIPSALLFPAPRLPRGHVLLGYDERGHCPMLVDGQCSIYEHRPRTCRTYDCRVFPASGLHLDDDERKVLIARTGAAVAVHVQQRAGRAGARRRPSGSDIPRRARQTCSRRAPFRRTRRSAPFSRSRSMTSSFDATTRASARRSSIRIPMWSEPRCCTGRAACEPDAAA